MFRASRILRTLAVGLLAVCALAFAADDFPSKPIRIVVPYGPGQSGDLILRALADPMAKSATVPVIVDNKPGANNFIAAQAVTSAAPDGYTLFVGSGQSHGSNSALFKKLPYDPVKDLTPVILLNKGALIFVVPSSSTIHTSADLIKRARETPNGLTYGAASSGTRMSGELLQKMSGAKVRYIPYKSAPQAMVDMLGGSLDFAVVDVPSAQSLIQQGRVRGLAVTSLERHPTLTDIPAMAETLPGFEMVAWAGVFAPAGTPAPVVNKLNALFREAQASPAGKAFYQQAGLRPTPSTPEQLGAFVTSEMTKWAALVKAAGIQPE